MSPDQLVALAQLAAQSTQPESESVSVSAMFKCMGDHTDHTDVHTQYPVEGDNLDEDSDLIPLSVRTGVRDDLEKEFDRNIMWPEDFDGLMEKVGTHESRRKITDWGVYDIGYLRVLVYNKSTIVGFWVKRGAVYYLEKMNDAYVNGTHYDVTRGAKNLCKFVRSARSNWLKSDYKIIQDMLNATSNAKIEAKVDKFFN